MHSQPAISIVVPVYNVEKYVWACLQSIKTQSFTDFEVIVVDDGSTDNSATICANYCEEDCRFKFVHKENGGLSSARNYGLNIASGNTSYSLIVMIRLMNERWRYFYPISAKRGCCLLWSAQD